MEELKKRVQEDFVESDLSLVRTTQRFYFRFKVHTSGLTLVSSVLSVTINNESLFYTFWTITLSLWSVVSVDIGVTVI